MLARHFTWDIFHNATPISFTKTHEFYFRVGGVNFREEAKSAINAKITSTRKFPRLQKFTGNIINNETISLIQ